MPGWASAVTVGEPVGREWQTGRGRTRVPAIACEISFAVPTESPMPAPSWPLACHEPGGARVRADHRQVIRAVRTEADVGPQDPGIAQRGEQRQRVPRDARRAPVATPSGRSRPARARSRSGSVPDLVPSMTVDVCSPSSEDCVDATYSAAYTLRRMVGGSGSVTRTKPRRGRIGTAAPASAPTSPAQVPVALTTCWRSDRAVAGAHARHACRRAGASLESDHRDPGRDRRAQIARQTQQVRGEQHGLDLRVLRVVRGRGEPVAQVRLVVTDAGRGRRPRPRSRPRVVAGRVCAARRAPSAVAATTSPPLDSNSHRRPCSARSSRHTECEYSARSSSGPTSLSETSRLPSQALVVPDAI